MISDKFVVTLSRYEGEPSLDSNDVHATLNAGLGLKFSQAWVTSVRKYDPQNEVRTTKIPAIKRVRELLPGTLLRDAKFLVDTAEQTGFSRWSHVTVEYDSAGFRVIDKS